MSDVICGECGLRCPFKPVGMHVRDDDFLKLCKHLPEGKAIKTGDCPSLQMALAERGATYLAT